MKTISDTYISRIATLQLVICTYKNCSQYIKILNYDIRNTIRDIWKSIRDIMKLNNDMYMSCITITHIRNSGLSSKTAFRMGNLTESAARSNCF